MYSIVGYAQGLFYCLNKRNIKMVDEQNDENNVQVVTGQGENNDQAAAGQGENAESANQQVADESAQSQEQPVPYSRFKEVNDQKKAAEESAAHAQRQLEIIQANAQPVQQQAQTQKATSTYEQAMVELGITADDLYIGDNIVKVENRKAELDRAWVQYQTAQSASQQFINSHSDFMEIVGSVNPTTGQMLWSPEALALQQKKPHLAGAFQTAPGAYQAVMEERKLVELEGQVAANKEHANRQGVDVSSQPLGGSAAGGGAGGDTQNQAWLSREQVLEIEAKIAAGEIV